MQENGFDIQVEEVEMWIKEKKEFKLLDVREDFEREISLISSSAQLTETLAKEIVDTWDKNTLLVFYCHHGGRSLSACQYFEAQGFLSVKNMVGGIEHWALKVDPQIARY